MSEKKMVRRNVVVALGMVCVVVAAGLVGVFAYYVNDENNTISSLNSQISRLNSNVTNLQNQVTIQQKALNDLRNVTVATVDDIALNASAWLNKTVILEGRLSGPIVYAPEMVPPYDYLLFRYNETFENSTVSVGLTWNSVFNDYELANAVVIGVVRFVSSNEFHTGGNFIETESAILLQ
jgi:predicted PurR-regulated permease PerM